MIDLMENVKVFGVKVQGDTITCTVICNAHNRDWFNGSVIDNPVYNGKRGGTRWTTAGDYIPSEVKQKVVEYLKNQWENAM